MDRAYVTPWTGGGRLRSTGRRCPSARGRPRWMSSRPGGSTSGGWPSRSTGRSAPGRSLAPAGWRAARPWRSSPSWAVADADRPARRAHRDRRPRGHGLQRGGHARPLRGGHAGPRGLRHRGRIQHRQAGVPSVRCRPQEDRGPRGDPVGDRPGDGRRGPRRQADAGQRLRRVLRMRRGVRGPGRPGAEGHAGRDPDRRDARGPGGRLLRHGRDRRGQRDCHPQGNARPVRLRGRGLGRGGRAPQRRQGVGLRGPHGPGGPAPASRGGPRGRDAAEQWSGARCQTIWS